LPLETLGEAVRELLETEQSDAFAEVWTATMADWQELLPKKLGRDFDHPLGDEPEIVLQRNRDSVARSAAHLLDIAHRLGGIPRHLLVKTVSGKPLTIEHDLGDGKTISIDAATAVRVILVGTPEPTATDPTPAAEELEIAISRLQHMPSGWKIADGIRWQRLPTTAIDAATAAELAITTKITDDWNEPGTLTDAEDPALRKVAEAWVARLRGQPTRAFVTQAAMTAEEVRSFTKLIEWNPADDGTQALQAMHRQVAASADAIAGTLSRLAIDLSDADIRIGEIVARDVGMNPASYGSLEGISARSIAFTLAVNSPRKTAAGQSISGEYALVTGSAIRVGGRWSLQDDRARWASLPDAVTTDAERDRLAMEKSTIETGLIPDGTMAPEITLQRFDSGAAVRLSQLRGKLVVLEWWSVSCAPCQPAMAELQRMIAAHPDWADRVEVMAINVDEDLAAAKDHAAKRGWSNTTNLWAGPGGFDSVAAKRFRLQAIPTTYLIGRDGRIVASNHGAEIDAAVLAHLER
jgi:thiol-disulfide isomerase/thioredoxin